MSAMRCSLICNKRWTKYAGVMTSVCTPLPSSCVTGVLALVPVPTLATLPLLVALDDAAVPPLRVELAFR